MNIPYLCKQFVHGLQNEFDKAAVRRAQGCLLGELATVGNQFKRSISQQNGLLLTSIPSLPNNYC